MFLKSAGSPKQIVEYYFLYEPWSYVMTCPSCSPVATVWWRHSLETVSPECLSRRSEPDHARDCRKRARRSRTEASGSVASRYEGSWIYLTIIELTMCPCVWQSTPKTADVTVTKIACYVRVRILMNRWFFRIFGIHSFCATATLLNIWICMQWADAADDGRGCGLDFAPMHAVAPSRGFPACYIW